MARRSYSPSRSLGFVAATIAAAAAGAAASCITTETYVYTAQKYDEANDCLAAYTPVETVNGSGARATCPTACLSVGEALYVSTMCPPLPAVATPVGADAGACKAALAAAARGGTCDARGEGGADASGDASIDASSEAASGDAASDADDASDAAPIADAGDAG